MSQKDEMDQTAGANKWRDIAEETQRDDEQLASEEVFESLEGVDSEEKNDKVLLLEKQIQSYKDQLLRMQAEVENARRRMDQEVAKARKFGVERLVSDLVPVLDSLTRAMDGVQDQDPRVQAMRQGIDLTLTMLHNLLEKNGIVKIDPAAGEAFDPMQHEAMSMRADPDAKHNTVLEVLQQGYALNGRVIRAAMVIVAA